MYAYLLSVSLCSHVFLKTYLHSLPYIFQPPGVMHGVETKFQMTQHGQFIILESLKERGRHVGVLPGGALKPALATGKEDHAMFGVRLMVRRKTNK